MADRVERWTETADRVFVDSHFLLGEGEDGRFYVHPFRGVLWRRVSRWNPRYWLAYLGSRLTQQLVFLERQEN